MKTTDLSQNTPSQDIDSIRKPVESDMLTLDSCLLDALASEVPLISQVGEHILKAGGKRLRPLLMFLVAKACDYSGDSEHHELAVVIEFIHMATLLHDDVIDQPEMRRGEKTANVVWGNPASVLVGDFLYSRAFQILAKRNNVSVMKVLADATNQIVEGEVSQLANQYNPLLTEEMYYQVIHRKTAQLFSAAAEIAAIISKKSEQTQKKMAEFGLHLGTAYQIIDDLLDYDLSALEKGKNVGNDLAEGKMTLPLIYARGEANSEELATIEQAIREKSKNHLDEIMTIIDRTTARRRSFECAKQQSAQAQQKLYALPDSLYREALMALTNFIIYRQY